MQTNGNPLIFLVGVVLLFAGCSTLPMPVSIDPGQYRSGSESFSFDGIEVRSFNLQLSPIPLLFDPPSTKLTYAEGSISAQLLVTTPENVTGNVQVQAYVAPFSNGTCSSDEVYADKYRIGETTIPVGTAVEVTFSGVLSSEAVEGLNAGQLCLGARAIGDLSGYAPSVTVSWKITYIRVGVGIL